MTPESAHSPSQQSPSQQSQAELRHVTSTTFRSPRRASQMLRTSDARLGSRSPGSIPSSPTSVHSSSSAIFERDIEPAVSPSPPNSSNPHRIPRAKTTEQLELSVPSVLDSAAAILAGVQDPEAGDQIAVVTPATSSFGGDQYAGRSSGFTSPIGSFRSRSPSPLGLRLGSGPFSPGHRTDLLLSTPQQASQQQQQPSMSAMVTPPLSGSPQSSNASSGGGGVPLRPSIQTNLDQDHVRVAATPSIVTPTSTYFTTASTVDDESSPTATSHDDHESRRAAQVPTTTATPTMAGAAAAAAAAAAVAPPPPNTFSQTSSTSHPPSPTHVATKRLSFMSYSDLLSSTPTSTQSLSMLTTSASSIDPPPHLPSLTQGHHNPTASAAGSIKGFPISGHAARHGKRQDGLMLFDDVGGEWEREGFGKGLEERLDALVPAPPAAASQKS
ncbi:hypothetical protein AX15_005335 [Amanita polypyramis BW_CC]|nr:hypothetical protein AX15_005335 [Amanita polypyramis BW_CC]